MAAKTAVVILNWNGLHFLELFLPVLLRHSGGSEIYIADNDSTDNSLEYVRNNFKEVNIISIPVNEGFSKGYNIALRQIEAEYYVLLNSDVKVTEGWLDPIISLMDNNRSIAACQPKIRSYARPEYFEYAGAAGGFIDKYGYPFCRGRIFNEIEKDEGQYNDVCEIFWATGACMVVKAEIYWSLGGLDDDFFAHMEEIDLCWRIKNAGYQIFYNGLSEVYHVGGGTLDKSSPKKTYLNFRNGLYLLFKNLEDKGMYSILFKRMLLDGLAALKFLFFDSFGHFAAVIKAHFSFYHSLKILRTKRKVIKEKIQHYAHNEIFKRSIVIEHYLFKKNKFVDLFWKRN